MIVILPKSFLRWWIKQFGILTRYNGRWHYYTKSFYRAEAEAIEDKKELIVDYDLHKVVSNPSLYRLIRSIGGVKYGTLHKMECPKETRILIDWTKTDLFLPGLRYSEHIAQFPGTSIVMIAEPQDYDLYSEFDEMSVAFVGFESKEAATLWKLSA